MAFNPLHSLRKRQKVFMAILVFVCMVTFILSSGAMGGGDFFGWLGQAFTGQGRTPEVATLYGHRYDVEELEQLRAQRQLASDYMTEANRIAQSFCFQKQDVLTKEVKKGIDAGSEAERRKLQETIETLRSRQPMGQHYFGANNSTEDLLDFLIWKKQADRLGILLTDADVSRERDQEIIVPLEREHKIIIERSVANRRDQIGKTTLLQALADEFRVRLAKAALLGPEAPPPPQRPMMSQFEQPPPTRTVTSFTPHEYWEFFRKTRTEINVHVLPIPVRDLLSKVTTTPTNEELTALFEKYKDQEPAPFNATPGFKQPRRIQVEWVSGNSKEAPYPQAAEISLALLEATMPVVFQNQLLTQYNQNKYRFALPSWTEEQSGKALLPVLKLPEYLDAAKLRPLGMPPVQSAILNAVIGSYQSGAIAQDLKDVGKWADEETKTRKQFLASALALTGVPNPAAMLTAVPALSVASRKHSGEQWAHVPPLAVVQRHLIRNLRDAAAGDLLRKNMETFRKELEAKRSRPEEAKKYVAEAVKQFGFKTGAMQQSRDRFSLFADPGMEPLRDPVKSGIRLLAGAQGFREIDRILDDDPQARLLSRHIFDEMARTYTPRSTFGAEPTFTYWTTSDRAAYVPKFDEVKAQVTEAWRFQKAREAAKKEADTVADRVKKAGNDPQRELVDGSPYSGKLFSLDRVTRLKPPEQFALPGRDPQYTSYQIPKADIEFPTQDFIEKVLELKDVGDVVVLHDMPQSTYYVVAPRTKRNEPMMDDFRAAYRMASPLSIRPDPLLVQFDRQRRAELQGKILEQLRAEAKLKINPKVPKPERDEP